MVVENPAGGKLSIWLKNHIVGMAVFAIVTGVLGNFVYDRIKQPTEAPHPAQTSKTENVVLLVDGEDLSGKEIYAYVEVQSDRLEEFMKAKRIPPFYPEDYGKILAAGSGEPAGAVREKIRREYGYDDNDVFDIRNAKQARDIQRMIETENK